MNKKKRCREKAGKGVEEIKESEEGDEKLDEPKKKRKQGTTDEKKRMQSERMVKTTV